MEEGEERSRISALHSAGRGKAQKEKGKRGEFKGDRALTSLSRTAAPTEECEPTSARKSAIAPTR
jgi:hypothetical protein